MKIFKKIICSIKGHVWHPLTWVTVWDGWAHLWRGPTYTWLDCVTWGISGPIRPYHKKLLTCGRCGMLKKYSDYKGGVLHLQIWGHKTVWRRPVACAGKLRRGWFPRSNPFRSADSGRADHIVEDTIDSFRRRRLGRDL